MVWRGTSSACILVRSCLWPAQHDRYFACGPCRSIGLGSGALCSLQCLTVKIRLGLQMTWGQAPGVGPASAQGWAVVGCHAHARSGARALPKSNLSSLPASA